MTTETYAQLEGLWINAGGPPREAETMAAIAEAESGGRSDAFNASGATGLWQILGAVNPADQSHLKDPQVNAKEAVLKYKTQGLHAWVTYTTGAYRRFMRGNVSPNTSGAGGGNPNPTPATTTSSSLNPLNWITDALGGIDFTDLVERGALMLLGGIILFIGVARLTGGSIKNDFKPDKVTKPVIDEESNAHKQEADALEDA